jgi:dTDP-4-amino-4,6-dideoxygalactose transaminase
MDKQSMSEFPVMDVNEGIVLFHPHIPKNASKGIGEVLGSRWIGQGPKVQEFENKFNDRFGGDGVSIAVGSGTDALHLAYLLCDLKPGDEVIAPLFTCTATNIPFLYMGVTIRFADVQLDTLNIDVKHVESLINPRTKAIVCVHYGGLPCDMDELHALASKHGIPVVEDAAHALGATYKGKAIGSISDFTTFSFQAIKHITTGDGGMLLIKQPELKAKAERLRWFGIDRLAKQKGNWNNDITEVGYKYQMNDLAASLGLDGLSEFEDTLKLRQTLLAKYIECLKGVPGVKVVGCNYTDREHAAWLCTVLAENREGLMNMLRENHVESGQVHYRNDRYSIFGGRKEQFPNMDALENQYLVLPLHTNMNVSQVETICSLIKKGW